MKCKIGDIVRNKWTGVRMAIVHEDSVSNDYFTTYRMRGRKGYLTITESILADNWYKVGEIEPLDLED